MSKQKLNSNNIREHRSQKFQLKIIQTTFTLSNLFDNVLTLVEMNAYVSLTWST